MLLLVWQRPRQTRMGDPARTSHSIRMQHPEDSSAVRLAGSRGEKGHTGEWRHDHHRSSVQGTGRCAIYPYIKSAPASRREVHALEQVPPLAWQHCETCSMFDEAAEKQQHPQPAIATIVRQVTSNTVALCMSWNREFAHPTSPCRAVRKAVNKIRLTPLPPDSAMPLRAAPRRTPHSWQ